MSLTNGTLPCVVYVLAARLRGSDYFSTSFLSPWFTIPFGGLLPFVSVVIEMYCVLSDIWGMDEVRLYVCVCLSVLTHCVIDCAAALVERTVISLISHHI